MENNSNYTWYYKFNILKIKMGKCCLCEKIMLEKKISKIFIILDYYFLFVMFVFVLLFFFICFLFCFKMINSFFDHTNFDITQLLRETKMTVILTQHPVWYWNSMSSILCIGPFVKRTLEIFGFLYLLNRKKTCTCTFDLTLSDQTHNGMYETFSRSTNTIFMRRISHVRSN